MHETHTKILDATYKTISTLSKHTLNELRWIWLAKAAVAVNATKYKLITSKHILRRIYTQLAYLSSFKKIKKKKKKKKKKESLGFIEPIL